MAIPAGIVMRRHPHTYIPNKLSLGAVVARRQFAGRVGPEKGGVKLLFGDPHQDAVHHDQPLLVAQKQSLRSISLKYYLVIYNCLFCSGYAANKYN